MKKNLNYSKELLELILKLRSEDIIELVDDVNMPRLLVKPEALPGLVAFLKSEPEIRIDYLSSITAVHLHEERIMEIVYHLYSVSQGHIVVLKTILSEDSLRLPTIDHLFHTANWFEREVYDLFGVTFDGNRDLRRLMLPEDWKGHPLRKDYTEETSYNGMSTSRPDPLKEARVI